MDPKLSRSPVLLSSESSRLLVIDLQEKLLPTIPQGDSIVRSARLLVQAASLMDIPVHTSEQYPQGLGSTTSELLPVLPQAAQHKTTFSCRQTLQSLLEESSDQRGQLVIVGIEAHVCVLQTALDMLGLGWDCYLVVDAVGSRNALDREIALSRMEANGVTLTTTESVLFEWCEDSQSPHFKQISQWVKQRQR